MAETSVSEYTSFDRYPAAPALSAPMRLASSSNVVRTSTGISGQRSRSRGDNEVAIPIADGFFGWGLRLRLADPAGVRLATAPALHLRR